MAADSGIRALTTEPGGHKRFSVFNDGLNLKRQRSDCP